MKSFEKESVVESLDAYYSVYSSAQAEGISLKDSRSVLWNALKRLGFRPTSDLFNYIDEDSVIEIYDSNLVQVFRNLNFFKYCSYSLEELYCYQLRELYGRNLDVEKKLSDYISQVFDSKNRELVKTTELPLHIIYELRSSERFQIYDKIDYLAPLFDANQVNSGVTAFLVIEKASLDKPNHNNYSTCENISQESRGAELLQLTQPSFSSDLEN